ncbi:hypothetical protein AURANDRAFT_62847 [Aureococcus anophagefferens]|uniref:B-block binding subunit of TFIIIC domain-containing protein n=1 Tax=Aureococcus anophagefferens TaxID=44056 RepID=F0Y3A4_AURAN|nr:hypothetical protein AURANDRAFT_62847 [Aureococcus anophagefferens]EGB10226.1 hypothetical protein AURANDRAFT_62847 [Aureococcus anophagefferens]|eukprot:XP_009035043.1 hypothetical protein AURANDRAFT_62847 [Aureococcus anophagefferens]
MNHALLGAPEPPRTAHEWVDFTIEHAALQGPGGVALGALLSAVGLDAPALAPQRRAVARVLESGARGARAAVAGDVVVASEAERLRCLGVPERGVVDGAELAALEELGRAGRAGCSLSELQQRLRAREDQSKRGRGAAAESQALDKLCLDGLASKRLRTRTDVTANKTSKVTANLLRLARFEHACEAGGAEAWKRALVDVVLEHAALGDAHASIATFDPGADACRGGAGGAVAFCDAWARLKDGGAVARVQARVPGATPDLGACKTAAALEHCKRANRLFGFPLCFFVGNVSRGDGAPRELWCVGASREAAAAAGPAAPPRADRGAPTLVHELVAASGARGCTIPSVAKALGHGSAKAVERAVDRLAAAGLATLRKVTEGRCHSYLVFANGGGAVYNAAAHALARTAEGARYADLSVAARLSLDHTFRTAPRPKGRAKPPVPAGGKRPYRRRQGQGAPAAKRPRSDSDGAAAAARPARGAAEAAIVENTPVAPLARKLARVLVERARSGLGGVGDAALAAALGNPPRAARDAAASRALRRGWAVRDASGGLALPEGRLLDALDAEAAALRGGGGLRFLEDAAAARGAAAGAAVLGGDPGALATALGDDVLDRPRGGHAAYLLATPRVRVRAPRGPGWTAWTAALSPAPPRPRDASAARRARAWREAVTGDHEPWTAPSGAPHGPLRRALRRVVFLRCLDRVASTPRDLAESRGDRKPALEPPEVAALLLDLADAGCLFVDRGPPTESRGAPRPAARGLALFDAPPPPEPEGDGRTVATSRALAALRDRDGAAAPCVEINQ